MQETKLVQKEELFSTYREDFDRSLESVLLIHGIQKNNVTRDDIACMGIFLEGDMTFLGMQKLIAKFGKKPIITNCFNGNMSEFEEYLKALQASEKDTERAKTYDGYTSEEDGKLLLNSDETTYSRLHSTHYNRGLGANAGFVSLNDHGYVWQLFADGYLQNITPQHVKHLVFERYSVVVDSIQAEEIARQLNKDRRVFEGKILQGQIGDSRTVKDAISIITNEGKKKSLAFDRTNQMGDSARKICEKLDSETGKIVGRAVIDGNTQDLNSKTAHHILDLVQSTNQDVDDVLSLVEKLATKAFKKLF